MAGNTFSFTAPDGVEIFVYAWLPAGEIRAAIQIAHGMAEHAGRYARVAEALNAQGFAVYASDHRGHGQTASDEQDLGYFADQNGWNKVLGDLHQLSGVIKKRHPGVPFALFGHSMGSFLSQHFLSAFPGEVDAAVLSGSNGKAGALAAVGEVAAKLERARLGARGKSKLLQHMSFGAFNKQFAPTRTPYDWLSRDVAEVDTYIADPRCGFDVSTQLWIDLLGGMRLALTDKALGRIPKSLPIYIFSGAKDPVSNQGKGVEALAELYRKLGMEKLSFRRYDEGRHEMLNEINRDEVTADLIAFLENALFDQATPAKTAPAEVA